MKDFAVSEKTDQSMIILWVNLMDQEMLAGSFVRRIVVFGSFVCA